MANTYTGSNTGQDDADVADVTLINDGAAGTPSLNWASDTDTGIFLSADGRIGFTADGTAMFTMDRDGAGSTPRFSIGDSTITDTGSNLQIVGTTQLQLTAGTGLLALYTNSFGVEAISIPSSDTEVVINDGANDINFRVEGVGEVNALFVQGSDGFVGIGNAAPTVALDVTGALRVSSDVELDGALNHDGSTAGFLGVAPASQRAHVADTSSGIAPGVDTIDMVALDITLGSLDTAINAILVTLETFGFHATS